MFGFWYWLPVALIAASMLILLAYFISFILFASLYGEKVRLIIINLPGYTPAWFTFVDFSKPTRPWDIVGVFFFVYRVMGAVFTKKTTPLNESFKQRLPKPIILYLKCLRRISLLAIVFLFASWAIFHLQQQGYLN